MMDNVERLRAALDGTVRLGARLVSRGSGGEPLWVSDDALVYETPSSTLVHVTIEVIDGRVRA